MFRRKTGRVRAFFGSLTALLFTAVWILTASAAFSGTALLTEEEAFAAEKPTVSAQGAALYNATTGEFLYEKNADTQFYPASITKIMTALLTLENTSPDDIVTFTDSATKNLESGAVSLNLTTGDQVSVRDCLYGLLLKSANEVANGLAEHVSGSISAFAARMNQRAKELGCTNTNFVNPNGLNNANHVTTPRDMCLIAKACFDRSDFLEYEKTTVYHFPATINCPNGTTIVMGHKMISPSSSRYYPGILGGKTGYTSAAGNTLVTCAERNGVRLIAVVMKCSGTHYDDTKKLLDYGFALAGVPEDWTADNDTSAVSAASAAASETTATSETTTVSETNAVSVTGTAPSVTEDSSASAASQDGTSSGTSASGSVGIVSPSGNSGESASSDSAASSETAAAVPDISASSASTTQSGPGVAEGWQKDGANWFYRKSDGTFARDERLTIDGFEYWFDSDGSMATGWRQDESGNWYWLRPSFGGMKKGGWIDVSGKWYYLGADGRLLTSTVTPDGYRVDAEGAWIEESTE